MKTLDVSFDGVMDDLNGVKDMYRIMQSFVSAQDQNHIRKCFYCLLSAYKIFSFSQNIHFF